jgi:hypothetical protein
LDFGQRNGNVTAARVEEKQDRDSMYCKLKVTSYDDDKFESRMQGATDTGVMMMRKKNQGKICDGWNMSLKTG